MRAPLPTGAVTFAFTDIEGSTARWERNRAAMQDAVRRHDAIMRTAITQHGGHVFKTVGDAFCAAFTRPDHALAAMLAAQQALAGEDFSAVDGLHVRVALHTGFADERDGDYFGPALNRVARLLAIGHGGQILISGVTRDLAHDTLPHGTTLVDLGSHRVADLRELERVWQLDITGSPDAFPPLRSLQTLPNNLRIAPTAFVGRDEDIAEVKRLLDHHRLLTLVGSGGVGKTRLATAVAGELLDRYADGVWLADLSPITDPELVSSLVAQALGMSQQQSRRVDEAITHWLKRKKLLLIVDNCEHVVETVATLAASIIRSAADVRILATSRQPLDIDSEVVHRLPSLSFPAETAGLTADEAMHYGAVALFVDRARAADTRFVLADDNARVVAEICRRLDGIALAIELAAARVKVLSIPNLANKLNERFKILTGGSRSAFPRQKTLSALIDWSYDLLAPQEQLLFTRLGIFASGFSLGAATHVCGDESLGEIEILDLLSSLTDKSLVVADTSGEHERYRLLESTAAYALQKLSAAGERDASGRRHAEYFCNQALHAYERYGKGSTLAWSASVELELDNYRTVLEWALKQENDVVLGATLAGALQPLWTDCGLIAEGHYWIRFALERISEAEHPQVVAYLCLALARFASGKRRHDEAKRAIRLFESTESARGTARARLSLAFALFQMGRLDEAKAAIERSLASSRECGDEVCVADGLNVQASIAHARGDARAGDELRAQALRAYKALGDESGIAEMLGNMAEVESAAGQPERALRFASDAQELRLRGKDAQGLATIQNNIAAYNIALGEFTAARESAREGLRLARRAQYEIGIAIAVQHLALLAALGGSARPAAQALGYVDAEYTRLEQRREDTEQWGYDQLLTTLRESLSNDEIKNLAAEGASWSEDYAVEDALNA